MKVAPTAMLFVVPCATRTAAGRAPSCWLDRHDVHHAPQHYCGEDTFTRHPEWRVKFPDGSDLVDAGSYQHDLTQPVRHGWFVRLVFWRGACAHVSTFGKASWRRVFRLSSTTSPRRPAHAVNQLLNGSSSLASPHVQRARPSARGGSTLGPHHRPQRAKPRCNGAMV